MLILSVILKVLETLKNKMVFKPTNINITFLAIFAYKLVCVDNKFSKQIVLYRGEMLPINSLKQFLKNMIAVKKSWKSTLNH